MTLATIVLCAARLSSWIPAFVLVAVFAHLVLRRTPSPLTRHPLRQTIHPTRKFMPATTMMHPTSIRYPMLSEQRLRQHFPPPAPTRWQQRRMAPAALHSHAQSIPSPTAAPASFTYTHLEVNSQLWNVGDVCLCIDPVVGQLDFGIPNLYRANPSVLQDTAATIELIVASKPVAILLTQGLDDHTHKPTLESLSRRLPHTRVLCGNSAFRKVLESGWDPKNVTVLRAQDRTEIAPGVSVLATAGSLVGPPWQERELGFLVRTNEVSVYYEPHGDVEPAALSGLAADVVVQPVKSQRLPAFTLVHGAARALEICDALKARVLIPLANGESNVSGLAGRLVTAEGTVEDAIRLAALQRPQMTVVPNTPGEKLVIRAGPERTILPAVSPAGTPPG